jgi:cell division protein FtsN
VIFVAGYLTASLYDIKSLSAWINARLSTQTVVNKPQVQVAQLPKPKFEFYTILANERVNGIAALPLVSPSKPSPVIKSAVVKTPVEKSVVVLAPKLNVKKLDDAYMVQVASFKTIAEAEEMKVELVMKGFDVKISQLSQNKTIWYRLTLGPFHSKTQAFRAQSDFARSERIMGMVRKMEA